MSNGKAEMFGTVVVGEIGDSEHRVPELVFGVHLIGRYHRRWELAWRVPSCQLDHRGCSSHMTANLDTTELGKSWRRYARNVTGANGTSTSSALYRDVHPLLN